MRNKGFYWFLTIVLVAVCLYQLLFTWQASSIETKAEKEADRRVELALQEAKQGDNTYLLPNESTVNFSEPDAKELAKSAFINQVLKEKANKSNGWWGTYASIKNKALAFGLDLVGGMSVTMEISVPGLIEDIARNSRDLNFLVPFNNAKAKYQSTGGDFVDLFLREYEKRNPSRQLVKDFNPEKVQDLNANATNAQVATYLKEKISAAMVGVEQIMGKRINQFGVAQPNIQRSGNRLLIELPGVMDEATVARKLIATANLEFYETFNLGEINDVWGQVIEMSKRPEVIAVETTDTTKTSATGEDTGKVATPAPSFSTIKTDLKGIADYISMEGVSPQGAIVGTANAENKDKITRILARTDIQSLLPPTLRLMWSAKPEEINKKEVYVLYAIKIPDSGKAYVGGRAVTKATASYRFETQRQTVNLDMNDEGAEAWSQMTGQNIGRAVAITMDGVVYSAPMVQGQISGGSTEISGSFTQEEANDLAGLLNGGALPVPCVVKQLSKVGPTIGAENSKAGLVSFVFAFLAVFVYMYFYYGKGGLIANVALTANVILIFGSLASFGAVLTLAGIAGIVLTIGTAVDANILIFERIKEELNIGKPQEDAINIGFKKALSAIIDANMTHLLSAIILKIFGTGEVESFATTLIIGIFTSLFTAIVISRLIIASLVEKGKVVTFSTKMTHNMFANFNFDWVGKRKYFYIFSIVLTIIGAWSLYAKGLSQSVEFTGGTTISVKLDKAVDVDDFETYLSKKVFVINGKSANVEVKTKSTSRQYDITTNYLKGKDGASAEVRAKLEEGIAKWNKNVKAIIDEVYNVSASVSSEMWSAAAKSIIIALLLIFAYILIRFGQWQYSLGALIGLIHDVLVVLMVFSLFSGVLPFNMDVNQAFIAAILTVIGYSMNDTVIVFDRIRENINLSTEADDAKKVINDSLNRTLSRTFNTSMILFVVLLVMFIFGGPAIKGFLFALLVGVVIGTYSSLCVATPILVDFTRRFKRKGAKA